MSILSEFIWKERFQYADINVLTFDLGQALRYYDFLLIILGRYEEANKKRLSIHGKERKLMPTESGVRRVTPEEGRLMQESSRLTTLVHLEIESFYLFAKVLLDNITRFLYVYFEQERGFGLKSHNDLAKHHEKYFKVKGLVISEGLSESVILLKERICDYRDKEISHELSLRRIKATAWGPSGDARIVGGIVRPRKGDTAATSAELPQLMEAINVYIRQVITLIESNRNKSRLRLKEM